MTPHETGKRYDRIADWWWRQPEVSNYGLAQLERALKFAKPTGAALDVGCGSEGRFIRRLLQQGYRVEGLDVAPGMIEIAAKRSPECAFHVADISQWTFPKQYDFISAWDSTFHLPLDLQEPVLKKMCSGLNAGGVLLFTCGGGEEPGEISGSFGGEDLDYSTLGVSGFLKVLHDCGCAVKHLEYDQYPENHVTIIATKPNDRK